MTFFSPHSARTRGALVLAAAAAALLVGLWTLEITRINCRYALMTAEIARHGAGLFPTINGQPYTDYTVSMVYLMHLATLGGRVVNMFTLSLPSVLATVLTLFLTWKLGERLMRGYGWCSAALLFLSYEFLSIARAPSLDMPIAAITVGCILLFYSADCDRKYARLWWIGAIYLAGFAIRGPLGVILPAAALSGYFAARGEIRRLIGYGVLAAFLCAVFFAGWLGLIFLGGGASLLEQFLEAQFFSRVSALRGPFFYFSNAMGSFAVTYPLGLLALALYAPYWFRKPAPEEPEAYRFLRILAAWVLFCLLLLSIPGTKHLRYAAPVLPALALAAGWIFVDPAPERFALILRRVCLSLCRVLPLLLFVATWGIYFTFKIIQPDLVLSRYIPSGVFLALAIFSLGVRRKEGGAGAFPLLLVGGASFLLFIALVLAPLDAKLQTARSFTASFDALRGERPVFFVNLGPDGDEYKILVNLPAARRFEGTYILFSARKKAAASAEPESALRTRIRAWINGLPGERTPILPMFDRRRGIEHLAAAPEDAIFVARLDKLEPLARDAKELAEHYNILCVGEMGHREFVIFEKLPKKKP